MAVFAVSMVLFTVVEVLHLIGIYVLIKYPKVISPNQRVYMLNLSCSEVILTVDHFIMEITTICCDSEMDSTWYHTMVCLHYYCFWIVNLSTMVALTFDRFAEVYFNIRYNIYFTPFRTVLLVLSIWIFSIVLAVIFLCLKFLQNFDYLVFSYTYIYPVTDTIVVLHAIVVYSYIYKKCRENRKKKFREASSLTIENNNNNNINLNNGIKSNSDQGKQKKNNSFFIPSLIVVTFIIFVYIPDATYFIYMKFLNTYPEWLALGSMIFYSCGFVSDVSIYLLLNRNIRRKMFGRNKIHHFSEMHKSNCATIIRNI
ncbi:uncharacterized protein LOC130612852 [Hydractinia symbiolongicarpus]|uniref:uncharacterized protein LOC130612852 n=1 Tax=Hydractinia symbiolongicarpus TaxID=13093 RepID=UPI00254B7029|nr:uncharacterized protein LOC130612852 [Hydractinia symbiolongicarpus]